jgi:hypothetical protein
MSVARTKARLIAELRFIAERTPRIGGVRFAGETTVVLIADQDDRFELVLPALVRSKLVEDLGALVDLEIESPVRRHEVTPIALA